jgi:hypothetical protein
VIHRRGFVLALGSSPLWLPAACAHEQETPLAHLYGKEWVHGAYEMYAGQYASIQTSSEKATENAYAMLAQKGVDALGQLQTREVPFFIRVDGSEQGFAIERDVPDRLTFTADMSDADRQMAQAKWEHAREHIQTDYEDIRRLNWALTTLLSQQQRIRAAIENGKLEQYKLVRQVAALAEGEKPPFELPYQVSVADYRDVLLLLLERVDDDSQRLARVESDIVTVGLTARATDSGSASLAANLDKVLLAVVTDSEATTPRAATFPQGSDDRAGYLARGKELYASISQSPEYITWEKHERTKQFDQIGQMLTILDMATGLHTSAIYKQVLDIWRGDADYLSYLKTAVSMLPGGSEIVKVANQAIELTEKARKIVAQVQRGVAIAKGAVDAGKRIEQKGLGGLGGITEIAGMAGLKMPPGADGVIQVAKDGGLLNMGSDFARTKIEKQLAFFKDPKELDSIKGMMSESGLMKTTLPSLKDLTG